MTRNDDFYGGKDPRTMPLYSAAEIARITQVAPSTVRSWVFRAPIGGGRHSSPIIVPADIKARRLSFENLVEVHVLSALRREHGVTLQTVRKAVRFLQKRLDDKHPLASREMLTDGVHVFVQHLGKLVGASQQGQQALEDVIWPYLKRVERDLSGQSVRLFPITRLGADSPALESPRSVAVDPRMRFGRPFLVDCGVETSAIADRVRAGESIAAIVADFGVDKEAVEEAVRYELLTA